MKTTEMITKGKQYAAVLSEDKKRKLILNLLYFILGLFISKGIIFEKYSPFGVAFIAATPYENIWISLFGIAIGYVLPSQINIGIRYIASALAICAIRWTFSDLKGIKEHPLFVPGITTLTLLATGFIVNKNSENFFSIMSMAIIESLIAGVTAYFFKESAFILSGKRNSLSISQKELSSIFIAVFVLVLSFSSINIGQVSLGRVLAIVIILFCSQYLGVTGGSVAGIAAGVIFGLAGKEPSYVSSAYSFGGLIAGVTAKLGKFALCSVFILSNVVFSVQSGNLASIISAIYEVIIATIIFIFLPDSLGNNFMTFFCCNKKTQSSKRLQQSVLLRIKLIAEALFNVGESINKVSQKFTMLNACNYEKVHPFIKNKVCKNCGLKTLCWETRENETVELFDTMSNNFLESGEIQKESFPTEILNRCCKVNEINDFISRFYRENAIRNTASQRINEIKGFMTGQFFEIGKIMEDLSQEFTFYDTFDAKLAQKIAGSLRSWGIIPTEVVCRFDRFRRLSLEIETLHHEKEILEALNLENRLSIDCGKALDMPSILVMPEKSKIFITEKPLYSLDLGFAQHICKNETLCGDNFTYFNDGMGRMIFILSDGMGTGGRAAVEGAMACEIMSILVKVGINFDTAVNLTNSSLLMKSEEESLATLDIVSVDLFSGKTEFIKAGAAVTFIKIKDKTEALDLPSLPVGILKNINLVREKRILTKDDKILLLSDGAIYPNEDWIIKEIESWESESSQNFADKIVKQAVEKRNGGHDDDITAIAIKVN